MGFSETFPKELDMSGVKTVVIGELIIRISEGDEAIVCMEGRLEHDSVRPLPFSAEPACHTLPARHEHTFDISRVLAEAHDCPRGGSRYGEDRRDRGCD